MVHVRKEERSSEQNREADRGDFNTVELLLVASVDHASLGQQEWVDALTSCDVD